MVCLRANLPGGLAVDAGILVYDPVEDTWTVEDLPWNADLSGGINDACVHNGRLVVFSDLSTVTAPSYQWGSGGEVHRWAHERAADGSWSSSIVRGRGLLAFVSESVLLG